MEEDERNKRLLNQKWNKTKTHKLIETLCESGLFPLI